MGRPRIGDHVMSATERMRRMRAKRAALRKAGEALRNNAPPVMPGADEAPLAAVQRAWAWATEVERAEIRAWVWGDRAIASPSPPFRDGGALRNQPPPMRNLLDETSAHTRELLVPIITGLKAEGRKKRAAMDRGAIRRFADDLETILQPGLREHFSRMIELLREASITPRTVSQIAGALEHALADHRDELPPWLRRQQPAVA